MPLDIFDWINQQQQLGQQQQLANRELDLKQKALQQQNHYNPLAEILPLIQMALHQQQQQQQYAQGNRELDLRQQAVEGQNAYHQQTLEQGKLDDLMRSILAGSEMTQANPLPPEVFQRMLRERYQVPQEWFQQAVDPQVEADKKRFQEMIK